MPFLYKHELDAFLVQAVDPHMMDTEHTQKLEVFQVPYFTSKTASMNVIFSPCTFLGTTNNTSRGYVSSYVYAGC